MVEGLKCWRCGGDLEQVLQPIARSAECPHCTVDLHCCRLCAFFDPDARRGCKEPVADEVHERDRSNFCGYFQPVVLSAGAPAQSQSSADLDALFGLGEPSKGSPADGDTARSELDRLFGLEDGKP